MAGGEYHDVCNERSIQIDDAQPKLAKAQIALSHDLDLGFLPPYAVGICTCMKVLLRSIVWLKVCPLQTVD